MPITTGSSTIDLTIPISLEHEEVKASPERQKRSKRFGIAIRADGHDDSPDPKIPSSQWGDPTNYFYAVTDSASALAAKERFIIEKDIYARAEEGNIIVRSVRVIMSRLNRLLRKYGHPPLVPASLALSAPEDSLYDTPPVELSLTSRGDILIPACRIADLWHPWYGRLPLDSDLFESFIDNWQTDVLGRQLAVDIDHRRTHGSVSLGWVNDIYLDKPDPGGIFYMQAEPTKMGRELLGTHLKYASIEWQPNYTDDETKASYGPVLWGVAATNNPYVRQNPPMSFVPAKSSKQATQVESNNGSGKQRKVFYIFQKEQAMPSKSNSPATTTVIQLGDRSFTPEEIERILAQNQQLRDTNRDARILAITQAAQARGVPPVLVKALKQIMSHCDPDARLTMELEGPAQNGEAGKEKYNFFTACELLLSIAPGRIVGPGEDETELDTSGQRPAKPPANPYLSDDGGDDITPEEAERLAKEAREQLYPEFGYAQADQVEL